MKIFKIILFALGYAILFLIVATGANYIARHYYENKNWLDFFAAGWPMTWLVCSLPFFVLWAALAKAPHARTIGIVSIILCLVCAIDIPVHYHGLNPGGVPPLIWYIVIGFYSLKMAIGNTMEHFTEES